MGKLAKIKTTENEASVQDFINKVESEQKSIDTLAIMELMEKTTNENPKMWGASLIGFGNVRYKSPTSGREVDWFRIGLSPRKANISLYLMGLTAEDRTNLLEKLGKHKTDKGCIYINKLSDVNVNVLEQMIIAASKAKL